MMDQNRKLCPGSPKQLVHYQSSRPLWKDNNIALSYDAFLGHFNLPVRVRNMVPYSRIREEDTSYRDEMFPKTFGHLLQGSCYEWRSEEHCQAYY